MVREFRREVRWRGGAIGRGEAEVGGHVSKDNKIPGSRRWKRCHAKVLRFIRI